MFRAFNEQNCSVLDAHVNEDKDRLIVQLSLAQSFVREDKKVISQEISVIDKTSKQVQRLPSTAHQLTLPTFELRNEGRNVLFRYEEKTEKEAQTHQISLIEKNKCLFLLETTEYFEFLYNEKFFGKPQWNKTGDKLLFLGEKKVKKDPTLKEVYGDFDKNFDVYFNNHSREKNFSSPIDSRYDPEVFILDLNQKKLFKVDPIKDSKLIVVEAVFGPEDELLLVCLDGEHIQQSLIYCFDRAKSLHLLKDFSQTLLNLDEEEKKKKKEESQEKKEPAFQKATPVALIKDELFTLFSLRFDPSYQNLYFLGNKEVFYEHNSCYEVWRLKYSESLASQQPQLELVIS